LTLLDFEDYPEGSICRPLPYTFVVRSPKQNKIEQERKEKKGEREGLDPAHSKFCQELCKVGLCRSVRDGKWM
jgi:hypothetical protein